MLVACSGGADSLALAAATIFEAPRASLSAGLVTVDHALRPGSLEQARAVASIGYELGYDPVEIVRVAVGTAGGPEAAARAARYAALDAAGEAFGATVLLGHTLDDQAETVLLGLGRGSGPAQRGRDAPGRWALPPSLPGCAAGRRRRQPARPLASRRGTTRPTATGVSSECGCARRCCPSSSRSCKAGWRRPWPVPQHSPSPTSTPSTRSPSHTCPPKARDLDASSLATHPQAIRSRVLRRWAMRAGVPALTATHLAELDALVAHWHGQARVDLPGGFGVTRVSGRLCLISPHSHKG